MLYSRAHFSVPETVKKAYVTFYIKNLLFQPLSHLLIYQISQTWYQMNGLTRRSKVIFV